MKNEKEKVCASGQPCTSGCWCGKCAWWKLLKLFLCLAVAMFVFVCGVGVGVKMSYFQMGKSWKGAEGFGMMKCEVGEECGKGNTMFRFFNAEDGIYGFSAQSHAVRLFGSVTKIEGNKITILDNSAQEQVVLSQPETIITATGTEVGISFVKTGMDIVSVGALNKDNQLQAKTIRVQ